MPVWRIIPLYEFQCPRCKRWFMEGNPLEDCPRHREGLPQKFNTLRDTTTVVDQVSARLEDLSRTKKTE